MRDTGPFASHPDDRETGRRPGGRPGADEPDNSPKLDDRSDRDDVPLAEIDVPDIRDIADAPPSGVDEDTVHPPGTDEVAAAAARAHEAAAELRNREALEARHEAEERAQQLATWHEQDESAAEDVADASADEVDEPDDYVDAEV